MITKETILKNLAGSKVYPNIAAALQDVQKNLSTQHFETVKKIKSSTLKVKNQLNKLSQSTLSDLNKKKT